MAVLDASKEMPVSNKYANMQEHFHLQKLSLFSNVMSSSFHKSQTSSCIFCREQNYLALYKIKGKIRYLQPQSTISVSLFRYSNKCC